MLVRPLLALAAASVVLWTFGGDRWLADRLYAWEGHAWTLKSHPLTAAVLHDAGKHATTALWLAVAAAWLTATIRPRLSPWRRPLAYLTLTTLVATLLVSWIKSWSDVDCPWDLLRYGGERPWLGLFAARPGGVPRGVCFPAGHASAGYAWVATYFFAHATRPRWRRAGLAAGLGLGLAFGVAQQLRGAHFLSHDLWTLAICWLVALAGYALTLDPARRRDAPPVVEAR
ncbi:MAG TPA: phosphatase PAP2 family protein [Dokdonella sp.]|nr:phosphatase PAP2 family protein [Dokdonella sp.]HUD43137.1 phosphatase PAP2 family protein [Dokdonella sp.]